MVSATVHHLIKLFGTPVTDGLRTHLEDEVLNGRVVVAARAQVLDLFARILEQALQVVIA